ncbi:MULTISPECIES: AAA family ATPase [unclassified Sinorhizobium]|uniref:AAA family ATPase n=1 Tax=unclassified Sinorhizobium TaxID=2613772 RepID=UPI0024C2C760|nr:MULTISPECIES: AAA family ATPase [unclassified Sinorhizobium]MDK1372949.1 AAA family ATPase [Sinorhizobium sp. 6-70]MDK1477495.1 AAA family ATPase [Sinorhizobium sp. 6-117]
MVEQEGDVEPVRRLSAKNLKNMDFPKKREIVQGLIPAGCVILVGAPKVGKSWFGLQAADAVASGRDFLGRRTERGDVLYLALEDGFARLQSRMIKQGSDFPECLDLQVEIEMADRGGLKVIEQWLIDYPDASMVIIDVLKMFRAARGSKVNPYDQDYADIRPLTALANKYEVAIVVVHHTNKGSSNAADPFDRVSGTGGISGAADGTLILAPDENGQTKLYGRGRDFMEFDIFLEFDPETCTWRMGEGTADAGLSEKTNDVLAELGRCENPIGPTLLAQSLSMTRVDVQQRLETLVKRGQARKVGRGNYVAVRK